MEKMIWTRPIAEVEQFMPNEYIAACGDVTTHYKFKCTSGNAFVNIFGVSIDAFGDVYTQDGENLTPGWGNYYHPCGKEHIAAKEDEYINGYFVLNAGTDIRNSYTTEIPVIIWTDGGRNVHCTHNTVIDSWEETKS